VAGEPKYSERTCQFAHKFHMIWHHGGKPATNRLKFVMEFKLTNYRNLITLTISIPKQIVLCSSTLNVHIVLYRLSFCFKTTEAENSLAEKVRKFSFLCN
jgi:hypothetical protein